MLFPASLCANQNFSLSVTRRHSSELTSSKGSARVALHAGAVSHQREVVALRAHLTLVAFCLASVRRSAFEGAAAAAAPVFAPLQSLELFRRRKVVAGLFAGERADYSSAKPELRSKQREIDDVEPAENAVDDRPEDRMIV